MMLQRDFSGVFYLLVAAAEHCAKTCGCHCRGRADFALAADLGTSGHELVTRVVELAS